MFHRIKSADKGFTLVELLVVIAIIGILVALLLPAIQSAREAARRTQCKDNVKNIGLALLNHVDSKKVFPTGGITYGLRIEDFLEPEGGRPVETDRMGLGWGYQILPYLEEQALHNLTNSERMRATPVALYNCPSRRSVTASSYDGSTVLTDYAAAMSCTKTAAEATMPVDVATEYPNGSLNSWGGVYACFSPGSGAAPIPNAGTTGPGPNPNGVFDNVIVRGRFVRTGRDPFTGKLEGPMRNTTRPVKIAQITDGTSKTLLVSEKYVRSDLYLGTTSSDDFGWTDGWDPDVMRSTGIPPLQDSSVDRLVDPEAQPPMGSAWWELHFGSAHPSGINAVFTDGSVRSISYDIDLNIFNATGTRNGTSFGEINGRANSMEGIN